MPTRRPRSCRRRTTAALSAGRTSASTCTMPTWRAIAVAVWRLSPVAMTTSRPTRPRRAISAALVDRGTSAMPINPTTRPSTATHTGVFPDPARALARSVCAPIAAAPTAFIKARLPTAIWRPSTLPWAPWPGRATKSATGSNSNLRCLAYWTTAFPSGCSG